MFESKHSKSRSWIGILALSCAACGGTSADDSATASSAVSSTAARPTTSGGDVAPALPSIQATAAPTEESPGVYTGVVTCNQPNTIAFVAAASEVVSFDAQIVAVSESGNPSVTMLDGDAPVIEGGNPVEISGAVAPESPIQGKRWYNIRRDGTYALKVAVDQCGHYRYRVAVGREAPVSTNLTRETASAITVGTPVTGVLGCEEHRFHVLEVTRRTTFHVSLGGTSRIPGAAGQLTAAVLDANGAPVVASGNPLSAGGAVGDTPPSTSDLTIARAGRYVLDVSFTNGCTIADYTLGLTR